MNVRKRLLGLSSVSLVILLGAMVKFALNLYYAPGYGYFVDELYTIALSQHLAWGYVDLPPLVPALVALSRALIGTSFLALHIVPALAGTLTLVFVCQIIQEFGGKAFAVALGAMGFIIVPIWLNIDSIFCYDSIDQLILAGFLYTLIRFLRSGNLKLWLLLGLIAGIACLTKMTILFLGPGFLVALLVSKYRKDLMTRWPWLGVLVCLVVVSPYLLWQYANHWPTIEYWTTYDTVKSSGGYKINAPLSAPMPVAMPKEKVQVSMELTAPAADGIYAGYFTLHNSNDEIIPIGLEKTFWVKFGVGAYAIVPTAPGANPTQPGNGNTGNCIHSQNADYVNLVISLINAARSNAGLQTLTVDTQIAAFAQGHAEDMAFNNFLSHDGSDGTFGERMMRYNTTHSGNYISGEILAIGTPQNAMDQWKKDEHWDFVLGNYTLIGVGYAYSSCSNFGGYFTVDFSG